MIASETSSINIAGQAIERIVRAGGRKIPRLVAALMDLSKHIFSSK